MTCTGPFQPPPSCGTLGFAFPPQAPQLSPHARWEGCWDPSCTLGRMLGPLMHAGRDAGTRDDPKLLPEDSPPNNSPPLHNSPWQTHSEERKAPFIADIEWGGPGVTAVQPAKRSQHLQRQRQRALLNPERQEEAGFCCPLFGEHRLRGVVRGPQERVIAGIDYGMPAAPYPHA